MSAWRYVSRNRRSFGRPATLDAESAAPPPDRWIIETRKAHREIDLSLSLVSAHVCSRTNDRGEIGRIVADKRLAAGLDREFQFTRGSKGAAERFRIGGEEQVAIGRRDDHAGPFRVQVDSKRSHDDEGDPRAVQTLPGLDIGIHLPDPPSTVEEFRDVMEHSHDPGLVRTVAIARPPRQPSGEAENLGFAFAAHGPHYTPARILFTSSSLRIPAFGSRFRSSFQFASFANTFLKIGSARSRWPFVASVTAFQY